MSHKEREITVYSRQEGLERFTPDTSSRVKKVAANLGLWLIRNTSVEKRLQRERVPLKEREYKRTRDILVTIAHDHPNSRKILRPDGLVTYQLSKQWFPDHIREEDKKMLDISFTVGEWSPEVAKRGLGMFRVYDPEDPEYSIPKSFYLSLEQQTIEPIEVKPNGSDTPPGAGDVISSIKAQRLITWLTRAADMMEIEL